MIPIKKDGMIYQERDATVVLKQFANNLVVFSDPNSTEMKKFVEQGKGNRKRREEIRDYILSINSNMQTLFGTKYREKDMLAEYIKDHRTYSEIHSDPFEIAKRKAASKDASFPNNGDAIRNIKNTPAAFNILKNAETTAGSPPPKK